MCTKNGSYCEKEKKVGGGGVREDVKGEVKLFLGGGGGGGGGGRSVGAGLSGWM